MGTGPGDPGANDSDESTLGQDEFLWAIAAAGAVLPPYPDLCRVAIMHRWHPALIGRLARVRSGRA